ncbi:hypothetical protein OUZ56_000765 [Daphnia magna]|uniref:Uncharacterized protein n=1 Tax=Daphnia magna TaxID=35525 RepID=A0ABR0A0P4_9CRUS|nr:hypothetical protein OUZ56_000765 [Daphnia magna]
MKNKKKLAVGSYKLGDNELKKLLFRVLLKVLNVQTPHANCIPFNETNANSSSSWSCWTLYRIPERDESKLSKEGLLYVV